MPPVEATVCLRGVSRRFGHRQILTDITLAVAPGELVLLMGKNGAGKTTLLRLVAGLIKPTTGTIERHGSVGMVAHHTMLYDALTARENLRFFARLHGMTDAGRIGALLERLGLGSVMDERIAIFSRGMQQRLSIARALLHQPDLLLLDEPLSGLDDAASGIVFGVLHELKERGCAVVIATHQLGELTTLGTRVGYLVRGRLAALEGLNGREADGVMQRYRALAAHEE